MFKRNSSTTRRTRRLAWLGIVLGFFLALAIGVLLYVLNKDNRLQ